MDSPKCGLISRTHRGAAHGEWHNARRGHAPPQYQQPLCHCLVGEAWRETVTPGLTGRGRQRSGSYTIRPRVKNERTVRGEGGSGPSGRSSAALQQQRSWHGKGGRRKKDAFVLTQEETHRRVSCVTRTHERHRGTDTPRKQDAGPRRWRQETARR